MPTPAPHTATASRSLRRSSPSAGDVADVIGTGPDDLLLAAAEACPSVAIILTDDAGTQVYP